MLPFRVFIIFLIMVVFAQVSKVAHGPLLRVLWTVFLVFPSPFTLKKDNMYQCLQKGNVYANTVFQIKMIPILLFVHILSNCF